MEFHFNFDKPTISKNVGKFLNENLKKSDADLLNRIIRGKKLQYMDANVLLNRILTSIIISDGEEEDEIKIASEDDEQPDLQTQSLTQPLGNEKTDPKIETLKNVTLSGSSGKTEITEKIYTDKKDICYFYTTNKCKFGKDCRKAHPKMCPKFKKFGLKKFNKNGCEESCENYHPKACFEAMKTKTCNRNDCKFFHLTGTKKKIVDGKSPAPIQIQTSNSPSPLASAQNTNTESVFQKDKEPWELAIEKMSAQMEMMMKWQQMQMNNQENMNFQKNNYQPTPNLRPQASWPSQSQSSTQSQGPYSLN